MPVWIGVTYVTYVTYLYIFIYIYLFIYLFIYSKKVGYIVTTLHQPALVLGCRGVTYFEFFMR